MDDKPPSKANALLSSVKKVKDAISNKAESIVDGVSTTFNASVQSVKDTIQGGRNLAADIVRTGGTLTGLVGGVAGEVLLFSAGGIPYLIFGGEAMALGEKLSKRCDELSQSVRGDNPQFIGLDHIKAGPFGAQDQLLAIIYDPKHPKADSSGFVKLEENQMYHTLENVFTEHHREHNSAYLAALIAIQDGKQRLRIPLECHKVSAGDTNEKLEI